MEGILFLLHKHIGSHHHTAESSGIDRKAFDKLYIRDRTAFMALHGADHQTHAALLEALQLGNLEGQTQVRDQASGFSKGVDPSGMGGITGEGSGLAGTAMEVEVEL